MGEGAIMHLTITDRTGAGRILMSEPVDVLISIGDDDRTPAGFHRARRRLRLVFDDITCESMASIMASYVPPTEADVRQIADFARQIKDGDRVLIHCAAGISRSTAAAAIVLMERGAAEDEALAEVKRIRPCARPNELMLAIYGEMR